MSDVALKDIAWGGRIRKSYQEEVWAIAIEAAKEVGNESTTTYWGGMLTSSCSISLEFLDGGVSDTRGTFDADCGMHWSGRLAKAFDIYRLRFDAGKLFKDSNLPDLKELMKRLKQ